MSPALPDWLARRASVSPEALALAAGGSCWTFAELDAWTTATARRLAEMEVRPGDRVALLLGNRTEFVALVHAAPRLGAVLVPLNTRLAPPEIAWQLEDSGARLLIHERLEVPDVPCPRVMHVDELGIEPPLKALTPALSQRERVFETRNFDLSAVHTIVYTSGTTGRAKGAMLTLGSHWWSAIGSALNLGTRHDDRWLAVLPLFHVGGLAILMRSVINGIPAIVHDGFDPAAVNQAIDEEAVTIVSVVSAMLSRMLEERGARPYPATLRCLLLGGGAAPRPLLEECARRGLPVVQTYGLTETASQVATLAPADALRKLGSAGKPLLPMDLRIEVDGRPAEVGEVGEIVVRGPSVMAGYVNRPEETRRALRDGRLRTGDLGYLDAEGYLYVVDRREDLIVSGGENVYPAEVEAVLVSHPSVEEAAVVGVPDDRWGQVPAAAIETRAGSALGEDELIDFCRQRLAGYKVPRHVCLLDSLPRNAAGKLLRREVRQLLTASSAPRLDQRPETKD